MRDTWYVAFRDGIYDMYIYIYIYICRVFRSLGLRYSHTTISCTGFRAQSYHTNNGEPNGQEHGNNMETWILSCFIGFRDR